MSPAPEPNDSIRHLETLSELAKELDVSYKQLARWSEPHRKIDFPKVKRRIGKYKLYDKREVTEWVYLWKKINKTLGNKNLPHRHKNKGRNDG